MTTSDRRQANRVARVLRGALPPDGPWVSTEVLVHAGGALLAPAVAVVDGELPYDGIVDEPPVVVVELDHARAACWAGIAPVWIPGSKGCVVVSSRGARRVGPDTMLRLAAKVRVRAGDLVGPDGGS